MAQTKAKSSAKRSGGSKRAQGRSRRPSNKSSKSSNSRKRASSPQPASSSKGPTAAVGEAAEKATSAVGNATGKATSAVGKAKVPLLAGGAALAGAAGGLALGTRQARGGKGIAKAMPRRPQVKVKSADVAKAAKEVGNFGVQLGQLADELQQARESSNGGRHRSPIEVVLQGLTARRSRA